MKSEIWRETGGKGNEEKEEVPLREKEDCTEKQS